MALETIGIAQIFYATATFAIAMTLLGIGKTDSTAMTSLGAGLGGSFVAIYVIWTQALGGLSLFVGAYLFIFNWTFLQTGIVLLRGYDVKSYGSTVLLQGILLALFAVVLFTGGFPIFTALTAVYCVLYFLIAGWGYGKVPAKVLAVWLLITTFGALVAPGIFLISGRAFA